LWQWFDPLPVLQLGSVARRKAAGKVGTTGDDRDLESIFSREEPGMDDKSKRDDL
jgi:hypothetical protein